MPVEHAIRALSAEDLSALIDYLEDHQRDNGHRGAPRFQPSPRGATWPKADHLELFRQAIAIPVGQSSWRRFWLAVDERGAILGHTDLRGRPEPCASHRALLGMGVHRDHRRQGIGALLLAVALEWATRESELEWIDLEVLRENIPAHSLYKKLGFDELATVRDMFRIDGGSVDQVLMCKRLRG